MEIITVGELLDNEEKYFASGDYILRYISPDGTHLPFRKVSSKNGRYDGRIRNFKIWISWTKKFSVKRDDKCIVCIPRAEYIEE